MDKLALNKLAQDAIQSGDDEQIINAIYILAQHIQPKKLQDICITALKS